MSHIVSPTATNAPVHAILNSVVSVWLFVHEELSKQALERIQWLHDESERLNDAS